MSVNPDDIEPTEADWQQAMEECQARMPGETVWRRAHEIAVERAEEQA